MHSGNEIEWSYVPIFSLRIAQFFKLSCIQCRRRKLKCDRQYPCSACTRRGAADECLYQKHEKGRIEDPGVLEKR